MITRETLCHAVGIEGTELEHWVELAWVVPEGAPGAWVFREIDVARARLIVELRHELGVDEEALPVVLSLLDQLYRTRRQMRALCDAMSETVPEDTRRALLARLGGTSELS